VIEANALTKRYGTLLAVDGVSFRVEQGEVLGFLGPNGAGKTTTMRILTGYLPATSGTAIVAGFDVFDQPMEVKRRVGYLPERPPLYDELTVGRYLRFVAELRGVGRHERLLRIGEAMEAVGLRGWERRIIGSLSKGYRQRVGLAQAIVHQPEVLILDEPTNGLDPAQTVEIRNLLRDLAGQRTIIFSTHVLSEVEAVCDSAVVIARGRLLAYGTLDAVRRGALAGQRCRVRVALPARSEQAAALTRGLSEIDGVQEVEPLTIGEEELSLLIRSAADVRAKVGAHIHASGHPLLVLDSAAPTLEEAFLQLVGRDRGVQRGAEMPESSGQLQS
jgi:ABC-2 type transport system ATP-binding protein